MQPQDPGPYLPHVGVLPARQIRGWEMATCVVIGLCRVCGLAQGNPTVGESLRRAIEPSPEPLSVFEVPLEYLMRKASDERDAT